MKIYISLFLVVLAFLCHQIKAQNKLDSQIQVEVNPDQILTDISQNPLGLCLSYPNDGPNYFPERKRSTSEAIGSLHVGSLRFPMGTLADNYMWQKPGDYKNTVNGLKPCVSSMNRSPGTWDWCVNPDGSFKESMLDFDEFMLLCKETKSEPIIMVNAWGHLQKGSKYTYEDIKRNAVEWVRYANIVKKHNIKYWEIGNELSVAVKEGLITYEEYIPQFIDFCDAMKAVDPTIKVGLGLGFREFGAILSKTYEKADFIVPHQYGAIKNFDEYSASTTGPSLNFLIAANNAINNCPKEYRDKIEMLVTEFSSFSPQGSWKLPDGSRDSKNDVAKSMVTFEMIASALSQFDNLSYMHFWVTHSPFGSRGQGNDYSNSFDKYLNTLPQGHAIALFNRFKKDKMVATTSSSSLVNVYASYSEKSKGLSVYLVNKSYQNVEVTVRIKNDEQLCESEIWTYTGENGSPSDTVAEIKSSGKVKPQGNIYKVNLSPVSISVINN